MDLIGLDGLREHPFMQKLMNGVGAKMMKEVVEQIEIELKYEGYIARQTDQIEKFDRYEEQKIPLDFDFGKIKSLSTEGREKLAKVKPESLGQASRISGVTPSDISVLMVYLKG